MGRLGLFLVALTASDADALPAGMQVGNQPLSAASCALRQTLGIKHYQAALYVPSRESPVAVMQDPTRPKALQVELRSKTFMPTEIPKKWRRTLEQQLAGNDLKRVREAYQELRPGDVITVAYAPGPGVSVRVNGGLVATTPNHLLVEAMLSTWAAHDPVPKRLVQAISRNPCKA
jgi:chalcone isomerase-like protein